MRLRVLAGAAMAKKLVALLLVASSCVAKTHIDPAPFRLDARQMKQPVMLNGGSAGDSRVVHLCQYVDEETQQLAVAERPPEARPLGKQLEAKLAELNSSSVQRNDASETVIFLKVVGVRHELYTPDHTIYHQPQAELSLCTSLVVRSGQSPSQGSSQRDLQRPTPRLDNSGSEQP